MRLCAIALLITAALTGCATLKDRGLSAAARQQEEPKLPKGAREDSRFTHARLAPDGVTGVFIFKREIYYPESMGLFFTASERRYLVNQSIIGAYDISSGRVRVLHRRDNQNRYIHEDADFHVRDIQGTRALISDGDQKYYWLDTDSGGLTPLPLKEEMLARGRDVGVIYFVDGRGTLILVNKSPADSFKTAAAQEVWLRRPSGEYERITEVPPLSEGYINFKDNEVHFYSVARRAYLIYNLDRRDFRKGDPRQIPYRSYDQVLDFRVDEHGAPQPKIGRRIDGKWDYREVQINTKELR